MSDVANEVADFVLTRLRKSFIRKELAKHSSGKYSGIKPL